MWFMGLLGCGSGTELDALVNVDPASDAGPHAVDAGEASTVRDPFGGAAPYAGKTGSGTHNAGMSCVHAGCHGSAASAAGAPGLLLGGTVYTDYKGTNAAPGVEVRIVDAAGHAASTFSGPEGNFYIMSSSANGVTFPAVVGARDAKTTRPMVTVLTADMASCGQAKCHAPGGGPMSNTGNYYPVHVP